mmetsp:Transcript_24575/g.58390  ORF Transcript_24575/g.58390 Transcript_24575/m.58390 type:complete len:211 (+) Transcript_24575:3381-4013(+)
MMVIRRALWEVIAFRTLPARCRLRRTARPAQVELRATVRRRIQHWPSNLLHRQPIKASWMPRHQSKTTSRQCKLQTVPQLSHLRLQLRNQPRHQNGSRGASNHRLHKMSHALFAAILAALTGRFPSIIMVTASPAGSSSGFSLLKTYSRIPTIVSAFVASTLANVASPWSRAMGAIYAILAQTIHGTICARVETSSLMGSSLRVQNLPPG